MGFPISRTAIMACAWLASALPSPAPAREPGDAAEPKVAWARRLEGDAPRLDGRLDEADWQQASWIRGLTQKDPVEGLPGGELTEVAFLYDGHNLYVGARCATNLTGRLHPRLSPRDDMGQTQSFFISLDTYHDKRTAYTFGVTAAGVRVDFHHPVDEELNQVLSWDPVWDVRTQLHDDHWIVEARIPFSQLRFNPGDEVVFGLQIDRWSPERDAEDYWCMVPRSETGWASRFGELRGIRGVKPSRRLELLPYAAGELAFRHAPDPLDPFADDVETDQRAGCDLKMGLGPNLTLDATFNPDFGQVEADPAQVNLTAFETVLEERRPFFLEGDRLLRGMGPRYYYSRRIGAAPAPTRDVALARYRELPSRTQILGAAKLSGRLSGGLSVAALAAVTDEERASFTNLDSLGIRSQRVAPRTGSGVVRLQQELGRRGSVAGVTLAAQKRDLGGEVALESRLAEQALSGGVDWYWRFRDGLHSFSGYWGASRVAGDSLAISRTQLSSTHYFQRPDASHVWFDPGRESLAGWAGALSLDREGGRHWRWSVAASAESPGFELNDMGQLSSADDISAELHITYEENQAKGLFRRYTAWNNYMAGWNFGGLPTDRTTDAGFWGQFPNYWSLEGGYEAGLAAYSDDLSRGGETLGKPGYQFARISLGSPELQRPNHIGAGVNTSWGDDRRLNLGGWVFGRFRPGPNVEIRVNPSVSRDWNPRQFLGRLPGAATGLDHDLTLFSRLDYREVRVATRLRYTFTPRLRVEYYAEPFMASLRFTDPGRPAGARSRDMRRYKDEGGFAVAPDGQWLLTEEGVTIPWSQGNAEYSSWRSTLVMRWDWRLGSAFYLVWQQDREHFIERMEPDRTPDPLAGLNRGGDNLIALKLSAWLPWG
jgi:hypothetical protein